ncbi:hypothetical protein BH24CHL9_BH24CHL9_15560 [soil metagenome]
MRQSPLESLFLVGGFSPENFPDLAWPVAIASFLLLVAAIVLYNVQTRRLHRHPPLVAMQEWLFWTALAVFGLLVVYFIFRFYFVFVVLTILIGLAMFVWIRFFRFPPLIEMYNGQLRRARFMSQAKYRAPEATIRPRKSRSRRRR